MTRRRLLCGLLLASVVLACFAGWLWMAKARPRFELVKKGMTREEVIRTVGRSSDGRLDTALFSDCDCWVDEDTELLVYSMTPIGPSKCGFLMPTTPSWCRRHRPSPSESVAGLACDSAHGSAAGK
jgi:hypothetical protein